MGSGPKHAQRPDHVEQHVSAVLSGHIHTVVPHLYLKLSGDKDLSEGKFCVCLCVCVCAFVSVCHHCVCACVFATGVINTPVEPERGRERGWVSQHMEQNCKPKVPDTACYYF